MEKSLRIALAQYNFTVGAVDQNAEKIIALSVEAKQKHRADLIVFPELSLCGYPPEDLLLRTHFHELIENALTKIANSITGIEVVFGCPEKTKDGVYNTAMWLKEGRYITRYHKQKLPNSGVFDECRYFLPGDKTNLVELKGMQFGLLICEDIWHKAPVMQAKKAGADAIICLNGSPFSIQKQAIRKNVLTKRIQASHLPIFYVNTVGGQDELVFDGDSQVIDSDNTLKAHAGYFEENTLIVEMDRGKITTQQAIPKTPDKVQSVYQALTLGVSDYVDKNGFQGVIVGVSGGVDSALTLTLAADALGGDRVTAVMMPSKYNADISLIDAQTLAKNLGVKTLTLPIQPAFELLLETLQPLFKNSEKDTTEENIQARIRGLILMALSNKLKQMVLSTGNKSETAMGYATLYGDMVGGFCALKDVPKTLVYELCRHRNEKSVVIPERILTRAPSAELKFNQTDQDVLPPYEILDPLLKMLIEEDASMQDMVDAGFDETLVKQVTKAVLKNEYKRRQAPIGIKISEKAFGKDRRYPITSHYDATITA